MPEFRFPILPRLIALGLALSMAMPCAALAASRTVLHEGTFSVGELGWESAPDGALRPTMAGLRHLGLPGEMDLPSAELLVLVPAGRTVADLEVVPVSWRRIDGPGPLARALPALDSEGAPVATDAAKSVGEATWGGLTGVHGWRGQTLASVRVNPVRPAADGVGLEFLEAYRIEGDLVAADPADEPIQRLRRVPGEADRQAALLSTLVANGTADLREQGAVIAATEKGFVPAPLPSLSGSAVSYVIITDDALVPEFQRLADHKNARGLSTVVVTRDFIADNYRNGADIQETMRLFIRDAYQKWGTEYVLLGGDSELLPPRYVNNNLYPAGGSTDIPCDLYFQCLDGNWNANGNSAFGEPTAGSIPGDDADFADEVAIGRAPVATATQAAVFVDKIIAYETMPAGSDWPDGVLLASEVLFPDDWEPGDTISLDGSDYAEQEVNNSIAPCTDMRSLRMYQTFDRNVGDLILTKQALTDSLNSGHYGIVNHVGHGYFYTMSVADNTFNNPDADALVNGDHTFMIYALNCASAAFDYSCLMERFIQNPHGGSVSSIGAVRAAFPVTSNNYQQEFFRQFACEAELHQGTLVSLSRLPWLGNTAINYTDRWTYENYTLLGDPSMELWSADPRTVAISAPATVGLGPQDITIRVTEAGAGVEGARVCLARDGEDWAFGLTDAAGYVTLAFLPVSAGAIDVTVSGVNVAQTGATISAVSGGAFLAVSSLTVVDNGNSGSSGNGNGRPEAGETVALFPIVAETGGAGTAGGTLAVATATPGVTVVVPSTTFGAVAAGGSVAVSSPLVLALAADMDDGTLATLGFAATSGGNTYDSEHDLRVLAPELELVAIDWSDVAWGNGDGILDDGERIALTFRAKNYGAGTMDGVTAYLRSDDANVTVNDSLSALPAMELLDESAGTGLSLTLAVAADPSDSRIVLVDGLGRTVVQTFHPQRPEAPLAVNGDASQAADVIVLTWDKSASPDVLGYEIYRSAYETGPFVRINQDLVRGIAYFRDAGLNQLTKYYYQVAAVDSSLVPSAMSPVLGQSTAPPEMSGFPLGFRAETSSHCAVGDVDGDGDKEIVLAADEVYVWHHDGSELLDGDGESQTLGPFTNLGSAMSPAGVALADIDGVPGREIVVSENGTTRAIHVFNRDGQELPGWPRSLLGVGGTTWNWATPAVGDIDGDGEQEIVVNTLNGRVWAWNADGTEVRDGDANAATNGVFYYRAGSDWEWSMSGPALADLDGDGAKDIIFGTRNDSSGLRRVFALRYDGTDVPGFPVTVTGQVLCHPAVGDLDNDGVDEIVVFTVGRLVYAIRNDGSIMPGFPVSPGISVSTDFVTSPALGDIDGDGYLEIVIAGNASGTSSALWVLDTGYGSGAAGARVSGWPQVLPGSSEGSPVVGDINGDGVLDVVHGIGGGASTAPNNLYAFSGDGTAIDGFPMTLGGPLMPSAVICDLDLDGDVDIVHGGWDRLLHAWDMPFAYNGTKMAWPTFQANAERSGVFFPITLVGVDDGPATVPSAFTMKAPYPNPFNPSTSVRLYVPRTGDLRLAVHDVKGRLVRTLHAGRIEGGWHVMTWDGRDDGGRLQASGLYFMRADADQDVTIHKMTLVK